MKQLRCNKCGTVLKLGMNFSPNNLRISYYQCNPCCNEYRRRRNQINRKRRLAVAKKYRDSAKGRLNKTKHAALRLKALKQATPKWLSSSDRLKIRQLYAKARRLTRESGTQWHVDHIVQLMGSQVCGLNVPWNLRVVPASVNLKRSSG